MLVACPQNRLRSDGRQVVAFAYAEVKNDSAMRIGIAFRKLRQASAKLHPLVAALVYVVKNTNGVMAFDKAPCDRYRGRSNNCDLYVPLSGKNRVSKQQTDCRHKS